MKHKVMPKKHLTSKVLDQHVHACASAQFDQGIWVFTVAKIKRLTWNKRQCPRKHMTTKVPDQHGHVHLDSLSRIFAIIIIIIVIIIHVRLFCLPLDLHVTFFFFFFFFLNMHSACTNDGLSEQRNKQINDRKKGRINISPCYITSKETDPL